jgi:hypothetical protein
MLVDQFVQLKFLIIVHSPEHTANFLKILIILFPKIKVQIFNQNTDNSASVLLNLKTLIATYHLQQSNVSR